MRITTDLDTATKISTVGVFITALGVMALTSVTTCDATRRSAVELRPWLAYGEEQTWFSEDKRTMELRVNVTNTGKTGAYYVTETTTTWGTDSSGFASKTTEMDKPVPLLPGQSRMETVMVTGQGLTELIAGQIVISYIFQVRYGTSQTDIDHFSTWQEVRFNNSGLSKMKDHGISESPGLWQYVDGGFM